MEAGNGPGGPNQFGVGGSARNVCILSITTIVHSIQMYLCLNVLNEIIFEMNVFLVKIDLNALTIIFE